MSNNSNLDSIGGRSLRHLTRQKSNPISRLAKPILVLLVAGPTPRP
ncbi:MAG: hypothetical protein K0Q54_4636 [Methylobacterium brachiatum]|jgi:hypothetical protein|nr:hypothetical protein [Methylobacterium brachiatum]